MKRIIFLMLMLPVVAAFAQKQPKPNLNKALTFMQEGKLKEAKDMIDAATTYEKTMNDGKTWYYRGLIYATMDTTANEAFNSLDPEPLKVALESFTKADQLSKSNSEYFVNGANGFPVTKPQQMEMLANYYLQKGIGQFQDDNDYEATLATLDKTLQVAENGLKTYPNDTLTYYVMGIAAQQADKPDESIDFMNKYLEKGGKSNDAYIVMYQVYNNGPKEDKKKALEVIQRGRAHLPNDPDFPKLEIGLLIDMGKVKLAKSGLEEAITKEPDNKILHFYLGYTNVSMSETERKKADSIRSASGKTMNATATEAFNGYQAASAKLLEEAKKNFEAATKIDPEYYDAHFHLANTYLVDVDKTSKEFSAMGNTPADSKNRSLLVQRRVRESEKALPFLEKVEKMKAPDTDTEIEVLQKLSLLYYYVADDKNTARVDKKLKALGAE